MTEEVKCCALCEHCRQPKPGVYYCGHWNPFISKGFKRVDPFGCCAKCEVN